MGENSRCDTLISTLPVCQEGFNSSDIICRVWNTWCWEIDNTVGRNCTHSRFHEGKGGIPLMEVAIRNCGGAGKDHLGSRKFSAPVDHVRAYVCGLCWKDVLVQPLAKFEVIGQSTEESHCTVIVSVNETRHEEFVCPIK